MKHLYDFKLFEKIVEINFPDELINEFEEWCNDFFDEKGVYDKIKNKDLMFNKLIQKFIDYVIDNYFYPNVQYSTPLDMEQIVGTSDDIFDILSQRDFRNIILDGNEELVPIFLDSIIEDKFKSDYIKYKKYIDVKKDSDKYNL